MCLVAFLERLKNYGKKNYFSTIIIIELYERYFSLKALNN